MSRGTSRDLVLLHGWAMRPSVWAPVLDGLAAGFRIHNLGLPGYNGAGGAAGLDYRAMGGDEILARWSAECLARAPAGAVWLGWSLGAMVALRAAQRADARIAALILVSATPRFVAGAGWPHGIDSEVMRGFLDGLRADDRRTLKRFVLLQAGGSDQARQLARTLGEHAAGGDAAPGVLEAGLAVLEQADLRPELARVSVPVAVLHGTGDRIVPAAAGAYLAQRLPDAALTGLDTGHAPFVSRPRAFTEAVLKWM